MKKILCVIPLLICILLSSCHLTYENDSQGEEADYSAVLETAQKYIDEGKYEDAYKALYGICDHPEAKEKLDDFKVISLKTIGNGSTQSKPRSYVCEYSYDKNGILLGKEEELPNDVTKTYTYTYDEMGRLIKEAVKKVSPLNSSYDSASKTKTESSSVEYTYNEQGDVINKHIVEAIGYPMDDEYVYEYDENGRKISVYSLTEDATTYFTYNEQGQLIKKEAEYGLACNFEYDQNGNLVKETMGSDWVVEYTYDERNNLVKKVENYNIGEYNEIKNTHKYTYNEYGVLTVYSFRDITLAEYVEQYLKFEYLYCPEE